SAKQVLPTSDGSSMLIPSTRLPPVMATRQPPPWLHPPSSCWLLRRYSSPFLTAALSGLGVTAVRISTLASVTFTGASGASGLAAGGGSPAHRERVRAATQRTAVRT